MVKTKTMALLLAGLALSGCGEQTEEFPVETNEAQALIAESTQDTSVLAAEQTGNFPALSFNDEDAPLLHDPLNVLEGSLIEGPVNPEPPLDPTEDETFFIDEPEDPLAPHYQDVDSYIPE